MRRKLASKHPPTLELLTTEEVAAYLRVSPRQVRRLARERGLPHFQLGYRTLRFERQAVEEWLRQQSQRPPQAQEREPEHRSPRHLPPVPWD